MGPAAHAQSETQASAADLYTLISVFPALPIMLLGLNMPQRWPLVPLHPCLSFPFSMQSGSPLEFSNWPYLT